MDQAPEVNATDKIAAPRALAMRAWPKVDRLGLASLAIDVGLVAGLFWTAQTTSTRLDRTHQQLTEQIERTETLTTQTAALTAESQAVKAETEQLRRFLASKSEVDVLFLKILVTKPSIDVDLARKIASSVHRYAAEFSQDPDLVLAIMAVESGFNPNAISNKGATGLMQIMPQWRKILGISEELNDISTSVRYGLQILGFYQSMYKDQETALTAYNRGPGPVDSALMKGIDPKNDYAPRVMKTYTLLKSLSVGPS